MACNSTFAFAPIQICSIDSVAPRSNGTERKLPFTPDIIIVDEAHRGVADSYISFLKLYPNAKIVGASATWWLLSGKGFNHVYDELIYGPNVPELVSIWLETGGNEGLTPAKIYKGNDIQIQLQGVKTTAGEYNAAGLSLIMGQGNVISDVLEAYNSKLIGRRVFIFCVDIAHSKAVCDRFIAAGVACEHLDGKTPDHDRKGILKRLAEGATQVVCNVGVCTTGVDVPEVSGIILARPTKSLSLYIQMAGRGLRACNWIGKKDCLIVDCADNAGEHGHVMEPRVWSLHPRNPKDKPKKNHKECRKCGLMVAKSAKQCPECGYEWVTEVARPQDANPWALYYRRALASAIKYGKKAGMAYHKTIEAIQLSENPAISIIDAREIFKNAVPYRLQLSIQNEICSTNTEAGVR
jgi:superfamily II DNA or RNA helicase